MQLLLPVPVTGPFNCIRIDCMGPLPETEDGNHYTGIAVDYFTKWPDAAALKNIHAITIAKFIYRDIIC
jgi:hypothetical protein